MDSPPSSPTSADPSSDDENLEGSFLLVSGEEDEVSSTIGSSLRDSVIGDLLSESSDDPVARDLWEEGDDTHEGPEEPEHASPSLAGGSFLDAEATSSELNSSMATIQNSTTSSQIRLIIPKLEASGIADDGSFASLFNTLEGTRGLPPVPFQRRRTSSPGGRGVEPSWLEASSKLWNIPPEMDSILSEAREYRMLASAEDVKEKVEAWTIEEKGANLFERKTRDGVHHGSADEETIIQTQFHKALVTTNIIRLPGLANKWQFKVSVLALAFMSVALLRGFHPAFSGRVDHIAVQQEPRLASMSPSSTKASLLRDCVDGWMVETTSTDEVLSPPTPTPYISDLQPIKEAKSTVPDTALASTVFALDATSHEKVVDPTPRRGKRRGRASFSCCSLSIRDSNVALATVPNTHGRHTKPVPQPVTDSSANEPDIKPIAPVCDCSCSLAPKSQPDMMSRLVHALGPARKYAVSASQYFDLIYAPAFAELQKEIGELFALAQVIAETTSTISQLAIHRAARGVTISRRALDGAVSNLRSHLPFSGRSATASTSESTEQHEITHEAITLVRASINNLAEYVEDQASALSEFVEIHTSVMHEKGMDSLKRAKKGLDKLIDESKKMTEAREDRGLFYDGRNDASMPLNAETPQADGQRSSRMHRRHRTMRSERRAKAARSLSDPPPSSRPPLPPMKPSRGRRLLDMVHHGALALVL